MKEDTRSAHYLSLLVNVWAVVSPTPHWGLHSVQCTLHWGLHTAQCTLHSAHCTHAQITTVSEDATHRKLSQGGYCNLLNWPWLFHNPFKERSLHILFVVLSQIKAFSIVFMGFLCHEMEITRRGIYLANEIIMPKALQTDWLNWNYCPIQGPGWEDLQGAGLFLSSSQERFEDNHKKMLFYFAKCFRTLDMDNRQMWKYLTGVLKELKELFSINFKCENISRVCWKSVEWHAMWAPSVNDFWLFIQNASCLWL